jgi:CheY-like chemotaxis protein
LSTTNRRRYTRSSGCSAASPTACSPPSRAEEALRWAEQDDVRVVLCDHRMPGMAGLELLREIRRRSPRTVCMLFTACN